jgi:acyl-CoA synthetase (AMP-forming)/AMP-acid ligase II
MTWIRQKLAAYGNRIACHETGKAWSYAEFIELIDHAATQVPSKGAAVIEVQKATTIEGLAMLLAIGETGHIALPLPAELTDAEQNKRRLVAKSSQLYNQLEGSGLVLFSSGTSGDPKGMLHNLDALLGRYKNLSARKDRSLLLLLIDHIGGLDSAFRCLFSGSTLVVPETRSPEAAGLAIASHQVNVVPASPTFLNLMLLSGTAQEHDLSTVEIIAYGAEAMPQKVLNRLAKAFPNAQLQQKFGTSETGAIRIKSIGNESLFFRIDDPDTQWKIVEEELWLKTPSRVLGYLNAVEDGLETDGWYRTGDLVETDEHNNLKIIGRASAVINVGGQKVHPAEVEAILNDIEGIEALHIYGKEAPITGSTVACEIVVSGDEQLRTWKRRIRNHCRGHLAPWKIPSSVKIVDSISVNSRMKKVVR